MIFKNKKILVISFLLLILGGLVLFINSNKEKSGSDNPEENNNPEARHLFGRGSTPSPSPFEELTIPYLREQSFESELRGLNQISQNSSYTSYLTSYDSDGLEINGLLTIPNGEEPQDGWPAVVFVHGYIPPQEYRTTEKYEDYVAYLASRGLVVFKIDLRGHGDSEGIPSGAYFSSGYIIDTLNAYSALQNADFVNPAEIALWGHSMAGNVTFRSMVVKQDIPKIVIWAGAVYTYEDMQDYRISDNSYRPPADDSERQKERELLLETHGGFDIDSDFWKKVVPTNYLQGVKSEIQIHHAINDNVVNIEYSRNLMNSLDDTSIPHRLYEYYSGGHNISSPSFTQAMQRTTEFLTNY